MYGLIFDVDGVIADTEAVNARASARVFAEMFGVEDVRREDFAAGLGRGAEAYMQAAAQVHGVDMTAEQLAEAVEKRQEYFLEALRAEPLPPFPGVMELIEQARRRDDIRVGIATSSTREKSQAVLQSAGVPYTELVYINGSDVTKKKPDPELFLVCAKRMGVDPGRCVVIEDSPDGVAAARAAGSQCIAVTNSVPAAALSEADQVVDTLEAVSIAMVVDCIDGS
jgi:sugar-phosphatase